MRKRKIDSLLDKIASERDESPGQPICIRPFSSDDEKLDEIAKKTGEAKSSLVRRMIRFALAEGRGNFTSNPCQGKLDWLVKLGRMAGDMSSHTGERLGDIVSRTQSLESEVETLAENSRQILVFLTELYCMAASIISSQNLTFTRLLEFSSPNAEESERAVLIAAAARANQISEAVNDLNRFAEFRNVHLGYATAENLFLLTKVEAIKDLLEASSSEAKR